MALLAGLAAGLVISVVQEFTTTPIILHAEEFEAKGGHAAFEREFRNPKIGGYASIDLVNRGLSTQKGTAFRVSSVGLHLVHSDEKSGTGHSTETETWAPDDGLERLLFTTLANILTAIGFALLLTAVLFLRDQPVTGRTGVLWGLAGFCIVSLAPSLGLPPEVPGVIAAEVSGRQAWWAFASLSTACGLWMMVFGSKNWIPVLGIALLVLPHAVGAPHPDQIGGTVPPELAAHFATASLVTAAVFWACLGWSVGFLANRLGLIQKA